MSFNVVVDTTITGDTIAQDVYVSVDGVKEWLSRRVVDTSEAQLRAALVQLGWTPPPYVAPVNGLES